MVFFWWADGHQRKLVVLMDMMGTETNMYGWHDMYVISRPEADVFGLGMSHMIAERLKPVGFSVSLGRVWYRQ